MSIQPFRFATDTATLCVFDLGALRHRLEDDAPDWWVWGEQVDELNAGNAAFLDLESDGVYEGTLSSEPLAHWQFEISLRCLSGQVFIGAGEEATSGGYEPTCVRGGLILNLPTGVFQLRVRKSAQDTLEISLCPQQGRVAQNKFTQPLRLSKSEA